MASGQVLLTAAGGAARPAPPERPSATLLRQARSWAAPARSKAWTTNRWPQHGAGPRVRALARVPRSDLALAVRRERFLLVLQPCRARWRATRWPCRRPTANTSSARWRATACAACTSAR
jgi:hypothetical protein